MKKKTVLIVLGIVSIIIASAIVVKLYCDRDEGLEINSNVTYIDASYCANPNDIRALNESYPSDIILYGEDGIFHESLNYRVIDKISESELISEPKFKYTFFVIVDREGKLNITDDEFRIVKNVCDNHNVNFYYIGEQYLDKLVQLGFTSELFYDNTRGIGYEIRPTGEMCEVEGFWSELEEEIYLKNRGLLGEILTREFVHVITEFE